MVARAGSAVMVLESAVGKKISKGIGGPAAVPVELYQLWHHCERPCYCRKRDPAPGKIPARVAVTIKVQGQIVSGPIRYGADAEERKIPYEDVLRYPENWPDISEMRDAEVKSERGMKQEDLAGIEEQRNDPQAVAAIAMQRHMHPYPKGHVKYTATPDETIADLKAATLADVKKFYADFYGAGNGELSVVGDFDEKEVAKLANDLFGGWKSKMPYTRIADSFKDVLNRDIFTLKTPWGNRAAINHQ